MCKKILLALVLLIIIGIPVLYIFREPVLQHCATSLIRENPLQKSDAIFVLSGGGYDRGNEAAKIYKQGYAPVIVCTGGNPDVGLKVFNIDTLESDETVADLKRLGIPDSAIVEIRQGTSTKEESDIILAYCQLHHYTRGIIVSSKIHTRRVDEVFRKKLKQSGIELILDGAPSSSYDEMHWWQSENGLIAVNNEWIKRFYYWWKY